MRSTIVRYVWMTVVLVTVSCAAGTSGGGDAPEAATFRSNLDRVRATAFDIARYGRQILSRYNYELDQSEETDFYVMFQTRWMGHYPYDDEIAAGVEEARSRVTIRARVTRGGEGLAPVDFTGENLVRMQGSGDWIPRIGAGAEEHFEDVAQALKYELESGIRIRR